MLDDLLDLINRIWLFIIGVICLIIFFFLRWYFADLFADLLESVRQALIIGSITAAGIACIVGGYYAFTKNTRRAVICGIIALSACILGYCCKTPEKSNLEKFNSIDIDLPAAGINKEALQAQFKKDPLTIRQSVERHKRKRFMLVTREHENAMTEQFVSQMKSLDILWNNSKAQKRCNDILKRLAPAMPEKFIPPEKIYILDTPEINACCLPNGTIIVFRGLLEKFNDAELAWVIAHELGHGTAHHTSEKLSTSVIQELAIDSILDKDSGVFKITGTYIAAFVVNLKYSRAQENEADRLALFYMNKAGYDMQGAVTALNTFKAESGEKSIWKEWLSTHPHPEKRLKNVKTAITQLEKDPDHSWGGLKDELLEKAKIKAIEIYMKR